MPMNVASATENSCNHPGGTSLLVITPDPWVQGVLSRNKRREKETQRLGQLPAHAFKYTKF